MRFHKCIHDRLGLESCVTHGTLSIDGVQESRSTKRSLHMFTLKFPKCSLVHTVATVRNKPGHKVDYLEMLQRVVNGLK